MKLLTIEPYPNYHFRSIVSLLNRQKIAVEQVIFEEVPNFRKGDEWESSAKVSGLFSSIKALFKCDAPLFLGVYSPMPKMPILFTLACLFKRQVFVASEGMQNPVRKSKVLQSYFSLLSKISNITFLCIGKDANQDYYELGFKSSQFRKFGFSEQYQPYSISEFTEGLSKYDDDNFRILLVGRLIPLKNFSEVIKACHNIAGKGETKRKIVIDIAGEGELLGELKELANGRDDVICNFHGHVKQSYLAELYKKAHLFVLPSLNEGWGVVVNNAIHYGLPCLCLDSVRSAEGFLVNNYENGRVIEKSALETTLADLLHLNNDEMRTMAEASYARAQLWSTENIATELSGMLLENKKAPIDGPISLYPVQEKIDV